LSRWPEKTRRLLRHSWPCLLTAEQIVALTGIATLGLTGAGIVFALKGVRDQLWLQMFSEYTRRYQEIVRDLPPESRDPDSDFSFDALDATTKGRTLNAVRGYLNLCSEEYYLYRRGRIDKETWAIWRDGIEEVFRLPWLRDTWEGVRHEYAYYEPFCTFLDECIAAKHPLVRSEDAE
jgi:hypothetical protein